MKPLPKEMMFFSKKTSILTENFHRTRRNFCYCKLPHTYIQSAWQMNSDEKNSAELNSLKLAKDFFSKIIVQNDIPETFRDADGILHVNLIEFLLNPDII